MKLHCKNTKKSVIFGAFVERFYKRLIFSIGCGAGGIVNYISMHFISVQCVLTIRIFGLLVVMSCCYIIIYYCHFLWSVCGALAFIKC